MNLSAIIVGPLELGWLEPTGRVPDVLRAWERGALGEVPAGLAWDVVRVPTGTAHATVRRLRAARVPLGPVLATPLGVDFLLAPGSADGWDAPESFRLPDRTLVPLPHPDYAEPRHLGGRSWIVRPTTGALTDGPALRDAYALARVVAEAAR
ncbi:hypothetical protein IQ279_16320 [Streptomyces verrucosisporus]|uniref:hypothetical protein n=1 Tax=Streptomyces verrucosisporus TaxID=1695161 RepID=UPI0019D1CCD6|nr:hypothetical protein [Streptomyces verrucosisporus]MBN3931177.1 hypothetical protein [Streptomyces verrucosisporus]